MNRGLKWGFVALGAVFLAVACLMGVSPRSQFVMGGALVNAGFRMQDSLHAYNFDDDTLTPQEVWDEFRSQNELAARVRDAFPRSTEHPLMALLVCMDARIDTSELAGDTRRYYYVVRTAGSIFEEPEQEMLELAVANGVKVVVLTRHTDCAAEKTANNPEKAALFPKLTEAVKHRHVRVEEFLKRPLIAQKVAAGELLVKEVFIDTANDHVIEGGAPPATSATPEPHAAAH